MTAVATPAAVFDGVLAGDTTGRLPKEHVRGTHRLCSPDETFARVWPHAASFGITRLASITDLDVVGWPVFVAIRPNSRGLATAQGKGADRASARVSALMEAVEGWHGEHMIAPIRLESRAALARAGLRVADIDAVPRLKGSHVRPDSPLLWVEGYDLLAGAPAWLPQVAVSTNYVWPPGGPNRTFVSSSNGLASGNHLIEAAVHGLCEVIERDSLAVALAAPDGLHSAARRVDLDAVDDEACRMILDRLARASIRVGVSDITSDIGIPCYACTIVDEQFVRPRWRTLPAFSGYGCHLSPAVALIRAISEAVQSRLTHISGSRDDIFPRDYHSANEDDVSAQRRQILEVIPQLDLRRRPSLATDSIDGDLRVLLAALRRIGIDSAIAVELTQPAFGIPVVKVMVPGLEVPAALLGGSVAPGRRVTNQRRSRA